uniref:Uncharacterized protein n=1 Tax=Rhizophora mucronata TaxID=61149 RepID=A0A2P2P0Z2_RHIMU
MDGSKEFFRTMNKIPSELLPEKSTNIPFFIFMCLWEIFNFRRIFFQIKKSVEDLA